MTEHRPRKRAVIFDFMRTLYDPLTAKLYPGVSAMLSDLQEERTLILYSRKERSRFELLRELNIDACFDGAYFVDTKDATNLLNIMMTHDLSPQDCIVVGDILEAELCAGSELGADTVFLSQSGTRADSPLCMPTHTVRSIDELHGLLKQVA